MDSSQGFILPKKQRPFRVDLHTRQHAGLAKYKEEIAYINGRFPLIGKGIRALAVHAHIIEKGQEKTCSDCGSAIYKGEYVTVDRWNIKGRPKTYVYCPECADGILGALAHVDTDFINYGVYPYDSFLDFRKTDYSAVDDYLDLLFQPRTTNSRHVKLI